MSRTRQTAVLLWALAAFLPGCGMTSPDPGERIQSVEKSTDQSALASIALNDPSPLVRRAAIARLDDDQTLVRVATQDLDENVRYAAAGMIHDASRLREIAGIDAQRALDPGWRARGWESHWNRMGLIIDLRKALDDAGVPKRLGWLRIDMDVETETADYSAHGAQADPLAHSPYEGEVVTIKLWRGQQMLAAEHWKFVFPTNTQARGMHEHAPVDLTDLIWDLQS